MVRRDKSGSEAETSRERRRNRYGLHTGSLGFAWERDWVVGSQILTQSHLRWFAKFRLAREETGDDDSGSDSSHAREFQFGVGYKRDGCCVHNGRYVLSPLATLGAKGVLPSVRICNPTTQLCSRAEPDVSVRCPSTCFLLFLASFRIASGLISLVLYLTIFHLLHFHSPVN